MITNKFTSKTNLVKIRKKEEKTTNKLTSIEKLLSPIPAKSFKEMNEISKYFKPTKLT